MCVHASLLIRAELLRRIKATTIDGIIMLTILSLIHSILGALNISQPALRYEIFLLGALYEPLMTSFSSSLGLYCLGLHVLEASVYRNGVFKRISFLNTLLRFIFKIGLTWVSLLTIHKDKEGKVIRDAASRSLILFYVHK